MLGRTGLNVSEFSLGTWQLTDDPEWGKGPSEKTAYSLIQKYLDLGGNLIDTAWIYGFDENQPNRHPSEELIGKFLRQTRQRSKVILVSKIPPLGFTWPIPKGKAIQDVFPKKHILKCVDDSLKSLQTDHVDLMLFHAWRDEFNTDDSWKEVCQNLTKTGKVKFWGLSPNYYEPGDCLQTLSSGAISVVQCIFNIFHQKPISDLFPTVKKLNIGLMACVPLDEGSLSGSFTIHTHFPKDDFRSKYFAGERLTDLVSRTFRLKALLGNYAQSLPELAFRFILSFDEVSTVVTGTRNLDHLCSNISVSDGTKLPTHLLIKLKNHAWERNFYPWSAEST